MKSLLLLSVLLGLSTAQAADPAKCRSLCSKGRLSAPARQIVIDQLRTHLTNVNTGSIWGASYYPNCEPKQINADTDLEKCWGSRGVSWMQSMNVGELINKGVKERYGARCEYMLVARSQVMDAVKHRAGLRYDAMTGRPLPIRFSAVTKSLLAQLDAYHCGVRR